jgi:hypothetical protein
MEETLCQRIYLGKVNDVQRFLLEGTAANCDTACFCLLLRGREPLSSSQLLFSGDSIIMSSPSPFEKREFHIESLSTSDQAWSTDAVPENKSDGTPFPRDEASRDGLSVLLALLLLLLLV